MREKREILRSLPSVYHNPAEEENNIEAINVSQKREYVLELLSFFQI